MRLQGKVAIVTGGASGFGARRQVDQQSYRESLHISRSCQTNENTHQIAGTA